MKKIDVRGLIDSYQVNCNRINEIAEQCERENRVRNEAEENEFQALVRENQLLQMKLQSAAAEHLRANPDAVNDAVRIIRENAAHGRKTEIVFMRSTMVVSDVENGGIVPLNVEDILKPLQEGFILDKVGLPLPTGLAGDYVWPVYEMVEATVLAENASLSDTEIPFSKLTATPARIGIAIPVTNQSLNQSDSILDTIIREIMPAAIRQLLNKILFSTEAVNQAASTAGLIGPFAAITENAAKSAQQQDPKIPAVVNLSNVPTFTELNASMKAKVLETGVEGNHLCWVMTKSMAAILEGTPVNSNGIYVPMIAGEKLCGLPVYTTNAMRSSTVEYYKATVSSGTTTWTKQDSAVSTPTYEVTGDSADNALATLTGVSNNNTAKVTILTEYIGLGDWRYQPMGLFGSLRFIVDPYSNARKDAVDFVLNCDYGTKTLRPEAFLLGQVAPVSNS